MNQASSASTGCEVEERTNLGNLSSVIAVTFLLENLSKELTKARRMLMGEENLGFSQNLEDGGESF